MVGQIAKFCWTFYLITTNVSSRIVFNQQINFGMPWQASESASLGAHAINLAVSFSLVVVIVYDLFLLGLVSFDDLGIKCLQTAFWLTVWRPVVWRSAPSTSQLIPFLSQACSFKMLNHAYWFWWWVASSIVCNPQPRPCPKELGNRVGRIPKRIPRSPRSPKIIPQPEMDPPARVEGWGEAGGVKSKEGGNPTRIEGDQPGLAYLAQGGCPIWAKQGLVQY